jgi:hypothetical protein
VDDELHLTALRMLVKDLLILFQAGNEAVINLLGEYFCTNEESERCSYHV